MLKAFFTLSLTIKHSVRQASKNDINNYIYYANYRQVLEHTKVVGQTKDVGFQIGVRRTFSFSGDLAWDFLFLDEGLLIWLGKIDSDDIAPDNSYKTKEGIEGKISVLKPYSHIRLTWKRKDWENVSTLQIRVIPAKEKTTISFHQDKLMNSGQREEMKSYWNKILEEIKNKLNTAQ